MLDVIFPVSIPNAEGAPECLEQLEACTDVPVRVIVVIDGGMRSDFAGIESFLKGCGMEWVLVHEEEHVYLNGCIRSGLTQVRHPLVAFMQPFVYLDDVRWFGKMQQVFTKDPLCGVIDTIADTASSAQTPVRRQTHRLPDPGCSLAMLSQRFISNTIPPSKGDPVQHWSRAAMHGGGTSWHAGGVNYYRKANTPHASWLESSVALDPSKSPLPTIPDSSTPTTIERAGDAGFAL